MSDNSAKALAQLPDDMPVIMSQRDDPPGDMEVHDIEVRGMYHDPGLEPTWSVWSGWESARYGPKTEVAILYPDRPTPPVIDAEIARLEIES